MAYRKLGRTSAHRAAMFRNQLASMIENQRIITTLIKAKELRPLIEKLVTLGKNDSVHARRVAERQVPDDVLVAKLFTEISPRFAERPGGYTRIIKLGPRRGDAAEMAILEFVDYEAPVKAEAPATKKAAPKKEAPAPEEAAEEKEAAPKKKPAKPKAEKEEAPKKKKTAKESTAKTETKKSKKQAAADTKKKKKK
jgi:large subunit ribosomal protein L17